MDTKNKVSKEEISVNKLSYEQAFTQLQEIVKSLETEELSLDEAMAIFERGQELILHCTDLLNKTELKVQQLIGDQIVEFSPQDE